MTPEKKIAERLRRLVRDAHEMGVALVADAGGMGTLRVMSRLDLDTAEDLRDLGESVAVHGACGGGIIPSKDANGNG